MSEKTLYESHPSMFRNHPIGFIISVVSILAYGLGIIILLIWWLSCLSITLIVTDKRSIFRKGVLSKHTTEVYHIDVRNIQLHQSFFARLFDVGSIGISSSGQAGIEIEVAGIPSPGKVKEIIDSYRKS